MCAIFIAHSKDSSNGRGCFIPNATELANEFIANNYTGDFVDQ